MNPAEVAAATAVFTGAEVGRVGSSILIPIVSENTCGHLECRRKWLLVEQVLLHDLGFPTWFFALPSDSLGFPKPFKIVFSSR